jgi:hypothetical protein
MMYSFSKEHRSRSNPVFEFTQRVVLHSSTYLQPLQQFRLLGFIWIDAVHVVHRRYRQAQGVHVSRRAGLVALQIPPKLNAPFNHLTGTIVVIATTVRGENFCDREYSSLTYSPSFSWGILVLGSPTVLTISSCPSIAEVPISPSVPPCGAVPLT